MRRRASPFLLAALCLARLVSPGAELTWNAGSTTPLADGGGKWATGVALDYLRWWNGVTNQVWNNAGNDSAVFGVGNGAAGTVTNISSITASHITFNTPGSGAYTVSYGNNANNTLVLAGTPTITVTNGVVANIMATIAGVGFTKEGGGALIFTNIPNNNSYTGETIVNNGALKFANSSSGRIHIPGNLTINTNGAVSFALSSTSGNFIADTAIVTVNGGRLDLNARGETVAQLVLDNGGTITNSAASLGLTCTTNFDLRSGTAICILKGTVGLVKSTVENVTLGAANTFTGNTTLAAGTLTLAHSNALQSSTLDLAAADSGTLGFGSLASAKLGGLKGSRALLLENLSSAPVALSIGNNNQNTAFSGNISGAGSLAKIGSGSLALDGAVACAGIVVSAGTLGGNGVITAPVVVQPGAKLGAGGSIGVLTISNSLTFASNSTCVIELDKAASTNDLVRGLTTVAFAGTLSVTNLNGTLTTNDTFKVFDAANYGGAFSAVSPVTPGSGLSWDISQLTISGTLKIAAGAVAPGGPSHITIVPQPGGALLVSVTNGTPSGSCVLLGSPDIGVAMSNWTVLAPYQFDSGGALMFTNTPNPAVGPQFLRIREP